MGVLPLSSCIWTLADNSINLAMIDTFLLVIAICKAVSPSPFFSLISLSRSNSMPDRLFLISLDRSRLPEWREGEAGGRGEEGGGRRATVLLLYTSMGRMEK